MATRKNDSDGLLRLIANHLAILTVLFGLCGMHHVRAATSPSPTVTIMPTGTNFTGSVSIAMHSANAPAGSEIRYTVDGSVPEISSALYAAPITIVESTTLFARLFQAGSAISDAVTKQFVRLDSLQDSIPDSWRIKWFGADFLTDPNAATLADPDGDNANNYYEYVAGTNPRSSQSHPSKPRYVSTWAGSTYGTNDGHRLSAKFNLSVRALIFDPQGVLWVGEGSVALDGRPDAPGSGMQRIRTISGDTVQTYTGAEGATVDGPLSTARFAFPSSLAFDSTGNMFVVDRHTIRKIDTAGNVSVYAGGAAGYRDGPRETAQFHSARCIAIDLQDNLYIADWQNDRIRKITPTGMVSTIAQFPGPVDIERLPNGDFMVGAIWGGVYTMSPSGQTTHFSSRTTLLAASVDESGHIYASFGGVFDAVLNKFSPDGRVLWSVGIPGESKDGPASEAQFKNLGKARALPNGDLLVADMFNIRHIEMESIPLLAVAPAGGSYSTSVQVVLANASPAAAVHFTLDGSNPTAESQIYSGPLTFDATTTLKAQLFIGSVPVSGIIEETYTFGPVAPSFSVEPTNQVVIAGQPLTLVATVTGSEPLHYQWNYVGAPIPGATNGIFVVPSVKATDAGSYSLLVSNHMGTASSQLIDVLVHYSLSATASDGGRVTVTPQAASYAGGTRVQLTATPVDGHRFDGWLGDVQSAEPSIEVIVTTNIAVTARFRPPGTLHLSTAGPGTIRANPEQSIYEDGQTIELIATPAPGYRLIRWLGAVSGSANPTNVIINGSTEVTAVFEDVDGPSISITSPSPGTTSDERSALAGVVTSNGDLKSLSWELNGVPMGVLLTNDGAFHANFKLNVGENVLRVTAVDTTGNVSGDERRITWQPTRIVRTLGAKAVQEGSEIFLPIELVTTESLSGMSLLVKYPTSFLQHPQMAWLPPAAAGLALVNVDEQLGEIHATFSMANDVIQAGSHIIGSLRLRTRSVPHSIETNITLEVTSSSDGEGDAHSSGTFTEAAIVEITPREILGDNNANDRLDVGDATLVQILLIDAARRNPWDVAINDLNSSQSLDAGDVTKILRAVVGIDPQPKPEQPGPMLAAMSTETNQWTINGAALNVHFDTTQSLLTAEVVLTNLPSGIVGATFTLDYPTNVLRLVESGLTPGNMVGATSVTARNANLDSGRVTFAFSSSVRGALTNGTLAQIAFAVDRDSLSETSTLRFHSGEVTKDGYALTALSEIIVPLTANVPLPPRFESIDVSAGGNFRISISGDFGVYDVLVSEDLHEWTTLGQVTLSGGTATFTDETGSGDGSRFYRLQLR